MMWDKFKQYQQMQHDLQPDNILACLKSGKLIPRIKEIQ